MFRLIGSKRLILGATLLAAPLAVSAQSVNSPHVAGELLVRAKAQLSDAQLEETYKGHGAQKLKKLSHVNVHHVRVPEKALEKVEAALRNNPNIEFVERNLIGQAAFVPNDPGYPAQWHLPRISAPGGWDITTGSPSVPIAIVDSGVDPFHPDLSGNLVPGYNFVAGNTDTRDIYGHGTAVAGVAAAIGNSGVGVAGVSWRNSILPLVVLDSNGYGTIANVASAITYAADNGAKVINLSLAFNGTSSTLQSAVNYAWSRGAVIVAAAANYSTSTPYYPAALSNVVAVSASDQNDNRASFSNYGNWIDVSAPGVSLYTTANGGGYLYGSGTSVAAPVVAGLAGLVFAMNPSLSNTQVVNLITSNADDRGSAGFDVDHGWGRVNVQRTLQAAYTAPVLSVDIASPSNGASVSGTVNVAVSTNSSIGINKVELYVNGALRGTSYTAPYTIAWNTSGLSGAQSLVSKAYDNLGNSVNSDPHSVSVQSTVTPVPADTTPPSVQITKLVADGKNLSVNASASDSQSGMAKVELYVDGVLKATDTGSPWTFKVNIKPLSRGSHSVLLKAYDKAGNVGTSNAGTFNR